MMGRRLQPATARSGRGDRCWRLGPGVAAMSLRSAPRGWIGVPTRRDAYHIPDEGNTCSVTRAAQDGRRLQVWRSIVLVVESAAAKRRNPIATQTHLKAG